jgi:hypothetical protein
LKPTRIRNREHIHCRVESGTLHIKLTEGDIFLSRCLFDQPGDFSHIGKALSFNILFRVYQLAVTFYIEDTASALDQCNIRIGIVCLQFRFHPGSLRKKVSNNAIFNNDFHNASLVYIANHVHQTTKLKGAATFCRAPLERLVKRVNTPETTTVRFTAWSRGETAKGKASGRSFGSDGTFHRTRRQDLSPQETCREQPRGSKAH